jgi:hypothetical protein
VVSCYGFGHDGIGQRRRSEGYYCRKYVGSCAARTLGKHIGPCAARTLGKHVGSCAARTLGKHISTGAARTLELNSGKSL